MSPTLEKSVADGGQRNGRGSGHRPGGRRLNRFFKALSDPTRRDILVILRDGEHSVGAIVERFHLAQPTISRHLAVLKEARLVGDQRKGQRVFYSLDPAALSDAAEAYFGRFTPGG